MRDDRRPRALLGMVAHILGVAANLVLTVLLGAILVNGVVYVHGEYFAEGNLVVLVGEFALFLLGAVLNVIHVAGELGKL